VLKHKTTVKFREVEPEFVVDLAERINELSFEFGIKQEIETKICIKIAKTLIEEFSDFSVDELFDAAKKYTLQQLDFKESHFQDLSIAFLSKVLISYKKARNKALSAFLKEEERLKRLELEEEDKKRRENYIKPEIRICASEVKLAYNKAQKNGKKIQVPEGSAVTFFRILMFNGNIKPSKEVLNEFRVNGYEELKKSFKSNEKLDLAFSKMQKNKAIYNQIELNFKDLIQKRAAKLFVEAFLDNWILEKKNVDDLFID
jgi:hypothetical protein